MWAIRRLLDDFLSEFCADIMLTSFDDINTDVNAMFVKNFKKRGVYSHLRYYTDVIKHLYVYLF